MLLTLLAEPPSLFPAENVRVLPVSAFSDGESESGFASGYISSVKTMYAFPTYVHDVIFLDLMEKSKPGGFFS